MAVNIATGSAVSRVNVKLVEDIDRHAMLFDLFYRMDADHSGHVDQDEFLSLVDDQDEKVARQRFAEADNVRGRGDGGGGDGVLNEEEFVKFMREFLFDYSDSDFIDKVTLWEENRRAGHRKLLLRRVFTRMDADRSGAVSLSEFRALADDDVGAANAATLYKWLEGVTGNSNGELTSDEWVPYVLAQEASTPDDEFQALVDEWLALLARKRRATILRGIFHKMDADSSGLVDKSEFALLADGSPDDAALPMVHTFIDASFGNADGELDIDEWTNGMVSILAPLDDETFDKETAKWMASLHRNQRALWRGAYAKGRARDFVVAARAARATHVVFVIHAHANGMEPPPTGPALAAALPTIATTVEVKTSSIGLVPSSSQSELTLTPTEPLVLPSAPAPSSLGVSSSMPVLPPRPPNRATATTKTSGVAAPSPSATDAILTSRGSAQCMMARLEWYGRLPVRRSLFTAPAPCAAETSLRLAGRVSDLHKPGSPTLGGRVGGVNAANGGEAPLLVCDALRPPPPSSVCATILAQKGPAPLPLRTLLDAEGGETAYGMWSEAACEQLVESLRSAQSTSSHAFERATYLSVCGHAAYTHALAHAVAAAAGMRHADLDAMLAFSLEDAEAVLVPLYAEGKTAIHLKADHANAADRAAHARAKALRAISIQVEHMR